MKIRVWCSIGLVGDREQTIDPLEYWGITDEEWLDMPEEERKDLVEEWASNYIEYGYTEL